MSDLHRSAFWIYGVTAFVVRDPLTHIVNHAVSARTPEMWMELARFAILMMLMARFFLRAGLYFEEVHGKGPQSAAYTRKSYPLDFLAGLMQFLLIYNSAVMIGIHDRLPAGWSWHFAATAAVLLSTAIWHVLAAMRGFTGARLLRQARDTDLLCLAPAAVIFPFVGEAPALAVMAVFVIQQSGKLIRRYEQASA